jgi:hypothetical protein
MWRRLYTFCSAGSLLLCAAVCVLWVDSYRFHTSVSNATETRTCSLVSAAGSVVFSSLDYTEGGDGLTWGRRPAYDLASLFPPDWFMEMNDFGFAFTRKEVEFVNPDGSKTVIWNVVLPHWLLACASGVMPLVYGVARMRRKWRCYQGRCAACGYDLRASPERCPECGEAV